MTNDFKFQEIVENKSSDTDGLYPSVKKSIIKIAENEGYVHHTTSTKIISTDGANYLGVLYEIDIEGETAEGDKRETNIFVKQVIPQKDNVKLLSVSEIYSREIFVYTELAKIFTELQDKANIPMKNRFRLAKMYDEDNIDAIILENMTKQGFKVYCKTKIMNFDYAKLCVEHLANFHALAFVIERTLPEYFENKLKPLKQPIAVNATTDYYRLLMNNFYELSTKKLSPDLKMKTDKWWKTALDNYPKYLLGTMTDVKCLCHGDFKMNNVMYKEIEGEITEVIAVDYQTLHYGSPVLDLIYFLYTGSDQKFRRNHLDDLKDHYYVSLNKYVEDFDVLVDDVYPRKAFEKDFEDCLDHALISCIWVLPLAMVSQDKGTDLSDAENLHSLKFNDTYYDRLEGVFEDCFK